MKVVPTDNNEKHPLETTLVNSNHRNEEGDNNTNNNEKNIKFYRSISCCLTSVISLSIVLSILFITAVWVSTFSASLITLAESNRRNEFNKLEGYLRQSVKEIESFGQTASGVLSKELEFYDLNKTESLMFSLFKSQYINTNGMEYFIFVVDADGIVLGFARAVNMNENIIMLVLIHPGITGNKIHFYFCDGFFAKDYCDRKPFGSANGISDNSGNNFILYYLALKNFGRKIWTPLYEDVATKGLLHMNMLTAFPTTYVNKGKNNAVFGYDFAASSMSYYLNSSTLHLPGVVVFVLETQTGKIVASNDPIEEFADSSFEVHYSQNTLKTKEFLYNFYQQSLTNLTCNYQYSLTYANRYVNVMRICTENGIDWVLVLGVEQWYYIGNIVIAITAAVVASIIIIITGIFVGIYFSSRIVKPFKQLIILFSLVSNMELEDITIPKSFFSEVKLIMYMFNEMVSRMKLYRSFIPSFLLTELEEKLKDNNNKETKVIETEHSLDNHSHRNTADDGSSHNGSSHSLSHYTTSVNHSSYRVNNKASYLMKFELGLEHKDVTVVSLRLNNFGSWMESVDNKEIVSMTTIIFQTVQQLAKPAKGQVGNFENGFITISFNAAIDADYHELKGCNIATALTGKLTQLSDGKSKRLVPFTVHCAVVSDIGACGNLGTSEVKTFTIIGNIQKKISKLIKRNLELDIPITISGKVQKAIKDKYLTRPLERVRFKNNKGAVEDLSVYELGESLHVAMDEWMYEMEQKESKNKWNNYIAGYELFMEGNIKDAIQKLGEHLQRNPSDKVCKRIIELCNKAENCQ